MRCALPALLPLLAATQLTQDGKSKLQAVFSPSQDRIAYYEQCPQPEHCLPSVVVTDLAGRRLSSFQPKTQRGERCGSVLSIAWVGADAIAAECHINPSLSEYIETELATGAIRRDLRGYWFTPSPGAKHVAHVGWVPHFAPPFARSNYLQIENTTIYPLPKGRGPVEQKGPQYSPQVVENRGAVFSGIHEFMPGFAWAADSERIALVDCTFDWTDAEQGALSAAGGRESNRRCSLAVVSVRGKAVRVPLPELAPDRLRQVKLVWLDAHQVRLQAGGITRFIRIP